MAGRSRRTHGAKSNLVDNYMCKHPRQFDHLLNRIHRDEGHLVPISIGAHPNTKEGHNILVRRNRDGSYGWFENNCTYMRDATDAQLRKDHVFMGPWHQFHNYLQAKDKTIHYIEYTHPDHIRRDAATIKGNEQGNCKPYADMVYSEIENQPNTLLRNTE